MKATMKTIDATTRVSLKNILYASDFSATAEQAAAYASELARRYDSRIYAVHVRPAEVYGMAPPESWPALREAAQEQAEQEAARLDSLFCNTKHHSIVETGDIWEVLSALIEKYDIDLVVMGTHGRKGLQKMLLGSVAENVLRRATCPVLTVGPSVQLDAQRAVEMKSILFATDLSRPSDLAAAYAISLAQENQARLDIVHVIEPQKPGELGHSPEVLSGCAARMHALIPPDAELWCEPNALIEIGRPAEQILNVARSRRSQLIVLGVKTAEDFAATARAPWAVAHKIISAAECPVFTVRR